MSSKRIQNLEEFCSPHSLLVHTEKQGLVRVHCPFEVVCGLETGPFTVGDRLTVEKVRLATDLTLLYEIEGRCYPYFSFAILL